MSMSSGRDSSERLLIAVLGILIGGVLLTSGLAQRMSAKVSGLTNSLTETTMPTIEQVATLRDSTLDVQRALTELVYGPPGQRERARAVLDGKLARFEEEVLTNFTSLDVEEESASSSELYAALERFEVAVQRTSTETDGEAAREMFRSEVLRAANRLGDRAMLEIESRARAGRELAARITETRENMRWLLYGLIGLCAMFGATTLVIVRRRNARQLSIVGAYARDQQSKADEMEQFAGRVAHDIRSPLASASLAAEILADQADNAEQRGVIGRLQRSLTRAGAITDGLLEFARAGANPEPGARTNVCEVIEDLADGLGPELEKAEVALTIEPIPMVLVSCSPGVFVSVVGNLVRNAIKYMGASTTRRIWVRVYDPGDRVRVEVGDTGPGIPEEIVPRLFEPYFRGVSNQAGLGLGLSTVRKLVEGHGGTVGVSSRLGEGSTFWFELPYAGAQWDVNDRTASTDSRDALG